MIYTIPCEACEEAKRVHELGCDCFGNLIAVAGPWAYSWGDWFREDLLAMRAANPDKPARLVCKKTGITFAGFVPNE